MSLTRRAMLREALPWLLVLWLALALLDGARQTSVTVDEFAHLPAGLAYWSTGTFSVYRHNPPLLRLLAAAPVALAGVEAPSSEAALHRWHLGTLFMRAQAERYHEIFLRARSVVVGLTCATAVLLFAVARRALGFGPGLVALLLFCFSPTVLAHGGLVTTDAGFGLAFLATCVAGAAFLRRPGWSRTLGLGLLLGLAQLTKFTALLLLPILVLAVLLLPELARRLGEGERFGWLRLPAGARVLRLGTVLLLAWLVLDAGYLFQGVGLPLSAHALTHPLLRSLADSPLGGLPFPLPADYVLGFDAQYREASGKFAVYLLGELGTGGWWTYYPLALLFKLPLPFFVLAAVLVGALLLGRIRPTSLLVGCLVVPGFALACFVLLTNIDIGVRYLLFLLPFGHLAVAHVARPPVSDRIRALLAVCLGWYCISSAATHPHYLGYFSELCGRTAGGHRCLADSNLDWGQDLVHLRRYLAQRGLSSVALSHFGLVDPAVYGIPHHPPGPAPERDVVVVSVNHLLGIHPWGRPDHLEAYRGREPSARVGASLWVFDPEPAPAARPAVQRGSARSEAKPRGVREPAALPPAGPAVQPP
jgi:hypothetical protein